MSLSSPDSPSPVSLKLEQLLRQQGITHAELARRLGVSRPAVSRMLSPSYDGHSVPSLLRIADALGLELKIDFSPTEQK